MSCCFKRCCGKYLFVVFLFLNVHSFAALVQQTLYINRGTFVTVKNTTFPSLAFNETTSFNSLNKVFLLSTSDTLVLKIVNNDTAIHGFAAQNAGAIVSNINGGDSAVFSLHFANPGNYIYYDPLNSPSNRYLGLAGMICVNNSASKKFFWNLKEHQTGYNVQLAQGNSVNWNNYYPDYFTINGKSFPDLQNDTTAKIIANVGDSLLIFVANTGQSMHSLHFHGFHSRCIFSSDANHKLNWEKDTWGMKSMEALVLLLIPDKSGKYSVHDHNLVAVSGGNTHPNGMFTIMEIQ